MSASADARLSTTPAGADASTDAPLSTRDLIRTVGFAARLVWNADRRHLVAIMSVQVLTAAGLAAMVLATKHLTEAGLSHGADLDSAGKTVIPILLAAVAVGSMSGILRNLTQSWQRVLASQTDRHIVALVLRAATDAELLQFEDPAFYDRLQRATFASRAQPVVLVTGLIVIFQALLSTLAIGGTVIVMAWWLLPLCALIPLPLIRATKRERDARFGLHRSLAESRRVREYLERVLTGREEAKEIRAFGLSDTLRRRWDAGYVREIESLIGVQHRHVRSKIVARLLGDAVTFAVIAVVWVLVARGTIELSTALAVLTGLFLLSMRLQAIGFLLNTLGDVVLYVEDLRAFAATAREPAVASKQPDAPTGFASLELRNVAFAYPGAPHAVLKDVDITLRAGEIVALVGTNGSGKTTLAKILAGLYPPDSGRLLRDGRDVTDPSDLRAATAVLFQDFIRYRLTATDNISFGGPGRDADPELVAAAARQAGIDGALDRLEHGYETVLSKEFTDGSDLSLGQWQRLALARAFYRDAPFVILDEPTASLDAQAEADLFGRIRELFAGRTVLFISHRFANVRTADRIYVLDDGRIAEHGTQQSLMERDGIYARLFRLQAEGYRIQPETEPAAAEPAAAAACAAAAEPSPAQVAG
jgi:ATP-binding cassette, subfamily B, bacterial